jgi:hypothetical protein
MHGNIMQRRRIQQRIRSAYLNWLSDFRPSFLPFSAAWWNLTDAVEVTREGSVSYLSFNFTLVDAPAVLT